MSRFFRWSLVVFALACACTAQAQEPPQSTDDLTTKSLPFRTALFHDPTLGPPLDRVLQMYRETGRAKDLVDLYRQHVAQYPADTGALIVLVRLLLATDDPEAGNAARQAATRAPDQAFLQFLLFEHLQKAHEAGALDALDRAIAREKMPTRQRAWIEKLIPLATAEGRADIAQKHLETLATQSRTAEEKIEVARKMMAQKLDAAALAVLESARALSPAAETGVELDLAAASAELGLQKPEAAAQRLDRLLARLAADYWRRAEILHRRTALVKSDAEREAMLAAARARGQAAPGDESAVLELAQLLTAFEFRREALDGLIAAAQRIAGSEKIEKTALELFDRLRDERGREDFLAGRLRAAPDRRDLALARTRSLFLLNRRADALAVFDPLIAPLEPAARLTQLLELARFLRRNTLSAPAAEIFERAVALAPARLDVRRELAEMWLLLGDRTRARAVFTGPLPAETETENLLDVIQFLLKQELVAEADAALAAKVAREPENFDLRLMQFTVAGRRADQAGGGRLIETIRKLADTDARYRRWLEAAVAFHEIFETDAAFLAEQQQRVEAEPELWTAARLDRTLAFVEVAAGHGRKAEMAEWLQRALAGDIAPELRVALRRRHCALVETDPAQTAAVEKQLQALLTDDPAHADEYRIRLAQFYAKQKRSDKVAEVLGVRGGGTTAIEVKKLTDAGLIAAFENLLREFVGDTSRQTEIAERLTALEPANRGAWERWLSALAGQGDEDRLRASLRRLLAGIDKLTLGDETRALLADHLLASHWRSLHLLLREAEKDAARLPEALPLLDEAERFAKQRDEWLWIAWTRAFTLNRLGRTAARDAAVAELDRVAALPPPRPTKPAGAEIGDDESEVRTGDLAFPDGLVIGLKQARLLLTADAAKVPAAPAAMSAGPRGALRVRWAFEAEAGATITKVLPLDAARVLVTDSAGRIYGVESKTGKLRWMRVGGRPVVPQPDQNGNYASGISLAVPAVPVVAGPRIFLPVDGQIECWSAEDGRLLWRAPGLRHAATSAALPPSLLVHADRLLVADPLAFAVAALDPATGKVLWQRDYPRKKLPQTLSSFNSGASLGEGRLLLYGGSAIIVNAADGEVAWSFDSSRVREFPISLADAAAPAAPPTAAPQNRWSRGYSSGGYPRGYGGQQYPYQLDYIQRSQQPNFFGRIQPGTRMLLAHSAAAWATTYDGGGRFGLMDGARLLLFDQQVMRTVRLDLPFSGGGFAFGDGNYNFAGTFVGMAARRACVLQPGALLVGDLDTGTVAHCQLSEISNATVPGAPGKILPIPLEAAVDASLIYVSGPGGIAVYHARSGERMQKLAWPAGLAPEPLALTLQQAQQPLQYFPQWRYRTDSSGRGVTIEPLAALVQGGIFYTRVSGSRLVALVGEEKDSAP